MVLSFFFFYQRANTFMLLCGTLTSEYVLRCYMLLLQANMATLVYGILSQAIMFAQLCVPTVGVICVTCEIWVYEICFSFFVFLVYGLIRLVWQPFQLRLRRWRLCGPGASVRAPVGRPASQALRWDSYCSSTRKSGRRV